MHLQRPGAVLHPTYDQETDKLFVYMEEQDKYKFSLDHTLLHFQKST